MTSFPIATRTTLSNVYFHNYQPARENSPPSPAAHLHPSAKPAMESLLSLSFDYLSSFDGVKIRKGLRQLEGLLAQICLSRAGSSPADRRRSLALTGQKEEQSPKRLGQLKDDPAFREFFKLQEGFEWNGQCSLFQRRTAALENIANVVYSRHPTYRLPRTPPGKRQQRPK